jgi:hypothetical protein
VQLDRKYSRTITVLLGTVLLTMGLIYASAIGATMMAGGRSPIRIPLAAAGRAVIPSTAVARPASMASEHLMNGVFCTSPANCWAVGDEQAATGAKLNQVLHWTGREWFSVNVPSQAGAGPGDTSELLAVRCLSAADCWAVGDSQSAGPGAPELDQALHWNGERWQLVGMPTSIKTTAIFSNSARIVNSLTDINCNSTSNCWAVGTHGGPVAGGAVLVNQVLHWNGRRWAAAPGIPDPAGQAPGADNFLAAVHCASATDCWAAGEDGLAAGGDFTAHNELLHWTGGSWVSVAAPNPGGTGSGDTNAIHGLTCTSTSDCWAAGSYGGAGGAAWLNELLHWDGAKWAKVGVPNPAGTGKGKSNELNGISCPAVSDCWAVGDLGHQPGVDETLHWNGTTWSTVGTPGPAGGHGTTAVSQLNSVRCIGPADCFAVGVARRESLPGFDLILRWTGKKWVAS